MTPPDSQARTKIGPLDVVFPSDVVRTYCAVIGMSGGEIPLSIVSRVYALPEFLSTMRRRYPGKLSIHLHHRVEKFSDLHVDRNYSVTFLVAEAARELLTIQADLVETRHTEPSIRLSGKFALIEVPRPYG